MRIRFPLVLSLLLVLAGGVGCAAVAGCASASFDNKLNSIVQPHSFDLFSWQVNTLYKDIRQNLTDHQPDMALNSRPVISYFSYIAQLNTIKSDLKIAQTKNLQGDITRYEADIPEVESQIAALKPVVEEILARQINQVLAEQGIYHPCGDSWLKVIFPPVYFKLEKPLYMLVVSPRDRIQKVRSIVVKPEINTSQMEEMESSAAELGVSALVVQIGGLGAIYPAFVANDADLRFTIDTAVEEWLHQYLAFKPLGFRYGLDLLGISRDADIPIINETVAGIASQELGVLIYDKYYSQYPSGPENKAPVTPGMDFNAAMRDIRRKVDIFLAQGLVEQAEQYMAEQRLYLAANGYYIRKLNQAYFAFQGTYAYSPTSIDPIGDEIRMLRKNSPSIRHFLAAASVLSNREDLRELLGRYQLRLNYRYSNGTIGTMLLMFLGSKRIS
jgi:hypothetical protein